MPIPPIPGIAYLVDNYASKIRTLGVFWFVYAGLSLLLGFAKLAFLQAFFAHHFGMWGHGPFMHSPFEQDWFGPAFLHLAWITVLVRTGLALAAGWGLMERARWGRFVALVAAFLNIIHLPFGTALAICTLVLLMGYRNNTLYDQLLQQP
jgi:uncharacterized membrane protein (DUF2068 family)